MGKRMKALGSQSQVFFRRQDVGLQDFGFLKKIGSTVNLHIPDELWKTNYHLPS